MKIVTSKEMARIEKLAYEEGFSENQFMESAGTKVGEIVHHFCEKDKIEKKVFLLIGKGNNGGDGYVAGIYLLQKGYTVEAFHLSKLEDSSNLNQCYCEQFIEKGGRVDFLPNINEIEWPTSGLVVDAILGTGFKGEVEGIYLQFIQEVNCSGLPVISIDIPSGLEGTTGRVTKEAIFASLTIYLGLPKKGFFINEGWNHVGKLIHADFGLPEKFISMAQQEADLFQFKDVKLPPIVRKRHKYQAGYVLGIAGSPGMTGSAKLSALAALRSGAGIVRLFHSNSISAEMTNTAVEVIRSVIDFEDLTLIKHEMKRAKAIFLGPGMGREDFKKVFLNKLIPDLTIPAVFDADALYLCSDHNWPKYSILTPHHQEMMRLLGVEKVASDEHLFEQCQSFAENHKVILVLKGAPSIIFHAEKKPVIISHGDPGMATAGTGDVLTGILSAILAQDIDPYSGACLGVFIHGLAGRWAAELKSSFSIIASDLIEMLPTVFKQLQRQRSNIL